MDQLNVMWNDTSGLSGDLFGFQDQEDTLTLTLKIFFYSISMLVSFFGNLCIIVVILRTRGLRTKFNFYMVNLALADFLVPVFCMWVHLVNSINHDWVLGPFFCKISTFCQVTVVCASIFTLTLVTLDRFFAAIFPSGLCLTQRCQTLVMIGIWTGSVSVSLPWLLYQQYADFYWILGHEVVCQSRFPSTTARKSYYLAFFILVYMVPVLVMFTLIVLTIRKTERVRRPVLAQLTEQEEMRRKAVYMLLTVLVVFCVCWTPQQSLLLWDVYRNRHVKPQGVLQLKYMALYIAYTSSAINPIIYFRYNKHFLYATKQLLLCRTRGDNSQRVAAESTTTTTTTDVIELPTTSGVCHIVEEDIPELSSETDVVDSVSIEEGNAEVIN